MKKCLNVFLATILIAGVTVTAVPARTVSADKAQDITQKAIEKTGNILASFLKEDNQGNKQRGFYFLGYAGMAMDMITMFLPTDPDPVMEKLKSMDKKLDSMSVQINEQGNDLFEHQDRGTYVAALTGLNGAVDGITDNRQNDLNKFVAAAQIISGANESHDNTKLMNYMPSINSAMQKMYEAQDNVVYLNAFRNFAKDLTGQGGVFGQDNICTIYNNYMHTTFDWNSQTFAARNDFFSAVSNTLNYTYGVLDLSINYDLVAKQSQLEVDNDQLEEWDKLTGDERSAVNTDYSKLENEVWSLEQDIATDQKLISDDDNATINTSIVKAREIAEKSIDDARTALEAEQTEFDQGKIQSYRLQNKTVRRNIQVVYGPRFGANLTGYKIASKEEAQYQANTATLYLDDYLLHKFEQYQANQQETVDHRLNKDEILNLKTSAERRGTNLFDELKDASFQGKSETGNNVDINNKYTIWAGDAHKDKKSYTWFTTGHQEIYLSVINNANKTGIENRQVVAYTKRAGDGKESINVYQPNPYVLAWAN